MRLRTAIVFAVLVAAVAALLLYPRAKAVEVVTVTRGPMTQTVVATGRIAGPARIELAAQATGTVERVQVRAGERVRPGQVLVRLRDDEARAAVVQARAALAEARARLHQIDVVARPVGDQSVRQAQANLRLAEAEHARTRELIARGFVSQARLDEVQRTLDNAHSALAAARAQAESNQPQGADHQLALARLAQAEASLALAEARLANQVIVAPVAATVLVRNVEPGDVAQAGRMLLVLAQDGETRVHAHVDERNLRLLAPGLHGTAVADAFPGERFGSEIYFVAPAVDAQRGTVEVRLRVLEPPAFLRPDMTVSVEMIVGRRDATLIARSDAVRGIDGPEPHVLAVRDGRAVRLPVVLGLRGAGSSELVQGVAEGERLILPRSPAFDGDRVRVTGRPDAAARPVPGIAGR
jgi:HlyD family secretion protein